MIDLLIIGGGIVGSWIALRAARKGHQVALCDLSDNPGDATSGRNSGVLHAGIYYSPGSVKARHCVRGHALTVEYLQEQGIPHSICGKLITMGDQQGPDARNRLEALLENARTLGARDLQIVGNLSRDYPGVKGEKAILSPHTGVCDAASYLKSVQGAARDAGCYWLAGRKLVALEKEGALLEDPEGRTETVSAERYINAAGLHCDEVARLSGLMDYEIRPVRGEYYRLSRAHPVHKLVYPLPDPHSTALGVHYTFHPGGDAYAGPNAVPADSVHDYRITQSASDFARSLSRILEGYEEKDFSPGYAGLRPRLKKNGKDYRDFVIENRGAFIHLLGIESPGLTSAISLSEEVMDLL